MSKPYSEAEFSAYITQDRSWRLREISDLKTAILRADDNLRRVLLRSLVAIGYAHWEGYVRFSARKYLEHIALRKFSYSELDRQFFKNYFLPRLAALTTSKTNISYRCDLIDDILNSSNKRFSRVNDDLIKTGGNLKFEVLADICLVCGVPLQPFVEKSTFLDTILLKRRNEIAHGEETLVDINDLDQLTNEIVTMMRTFGDALENHVYSKALRSLVYSSASWLASCVGGQRHQPLSSIAASAKARFAMRAHNDP